MLSVSTQIAQHDDLVSFERLLRSVQFADEILIFNMERKDQVALALFAKYRARVINIKAPQIVELIRLDQVKKCRGDWVLIMDYDEVIPTGLAQEIKGIVDSSQALYSAYYITRNNYSLGYKLRHGGFGQDHVPRLFNRSKLIDWPTDIHSMPLVQGGFGYCKTPMEHHKDASLSQMIQKTNRYTDVEAHQFFKGGVAPVTQLTLLRKTIMEFVRRYLLKLGFLDGRIGLIQALYQSYAIFLRYAKLYELQNKMKIEHNR